MSKPLSHVIAVFVLMMATCAQGADLQALLTGAKPGQTVSLPEGTFPGGLTVPAGVSVKGAGVNKTIIDAKGSENGLTLTGGPKATVSDLTIRSAKGIGLSVTDASSTTVARVRVAKCSVGIQFRRVAGGRIENCVSDSNTFGIVVGSSPDCVVVNCTAVNCSDIGISLAASPKATVFNNCVVGSSLSLNIDRPGDMRIDHNLYFGLYVGQMQRQIPKRMLSAWQFLTGLDAHSVQVPVEFKGIESGDFAPLTVLPWALDRAATADWGVAELGGVKAPESDIMGQARAGQFDVGVVEASVKAPRDADGQFTVTEQAGTKSAGVFTKDGMLVTYLFHNLPLTPGKYSFWLPARDYVGQPIPHGQYEVRLAQSDLRWKYLNHVGNNGQDAAGAGVSPQNPRLVAFAPGNLLVMLEGLSEDGMGARAYDVDTGELKWHVPGSAQALGLATGKDGLVYMLRGQDLVKGESRLTRVDPKTGLVIPFKDSKYGHAFQITSGKAFSMAALGERLYLADATSNKLFVVSMADGKVQTTLAVASPHFVAADEKSQMLWVVSGDAVVAMTADGKEQARSQLVPEPIAVAASAGKVAVASRKTGKIHFFDAADPKNLKPAGELGKGSLYGQYAPDRFFFQQAPGWKSNDGDGIKIYDVLSAGLALDPAGRLGVADFHRVSAFGADGKNLWHTVLVWGGPRPSHAAQRMWEGAFSFTLDLEAGTWKTEGFWDESLARAELPPSCEMLGDFAEGGKTFAVYIDRGDKSTQLLIARADDYKMTPVLKVLVDNGRVVSREDTNGDGKLTDADTATPLTDAAGKPLTAPVFQRFTFLESDGSITTANGYPFIWKRTPGLSAAGAPIYEGKNYQPLPTEHVDKSICPYDFKPGGLGVQLPGLLSQGGYVAQVGVRGSGGTGLNNAAGTDLAGFGPDGRRRWMRLLAQHKGLGGSGTVNDITVAIVYYSMESIVVDADGLGVAGFCEPPQLHFSGYWISPANLSMFKGADGKFHVLVGDHPNGRAEWFRLDNQQSLKRSAEPFTLTQERAAVLAALPWTNAPTVVAQPQPRVTIPRLSKPMKIDGDLEKWRKAGIAPVALVGPGNSDGPGDSSAIIRIAYEGQNLYFQVLRFDDVVTFHQREMQYLQDAVEMAINGAFPAGFQFIVYQDPEGNDLIHRHRFFADFPARKLRPEHAPRVVRVLDDAKAVTERSVLEALYGVDLSSAKVIVTEFMLPMDKETWVDAPERDIVQLGPGKTFWIGFFLDDNDQPYTDVQGVSNWPSTFGMFLPPEDGAVAECE